MGCLTQDNVLEEKDLSIMVRPRKKLFLSFNFIKIDKVTRVLFFLFTISSVLTIHGMVYKISNFKLSKHIYKGLMHIALVDRHINFFLS